MLIDVDEFGVMIERCNRKKGWIECLLGAEGRPL